MKYYYLGSLLVSFFAVILMIPLVRWLALKLGFLDVPSARKVHVNPIPLGGGLAVFLSFVIIVLAVAYFFDYDNSRPVIGIIIGVFLIVIIGLCDDYYDVNIQVRLLGQFLAAVLFLVFVDEISPVMSFPAYPVLAVLWIVSLQNAFNFLDNMDGLCAGISMMIAVGFGILFSLKSMPVFAIISFALAGAAIGFLRSNLPPAKIFLGDTGSLLFGFTLSCLAIVHLNSSENLVEALAPILIASYPIFDLTFVLVTRLNEGRKVYIGGKDHSSHKISFMGISKKNTVFIIYLINVLLVISGILLFFLGDSPVQAIVVVVFALVLAFLGVHIYKNVLFIKTKIISVLSDLVAINLAFLSYYVLVYQANTTDLTFRLPLETLLVPLIWINIFWIFLYAVMGLYDIPFERGYRFHASAVVKTVATGIIIFLIVNFRLDEGFLISLTAVLFYGLLLLMFNLVSRIFLDGYLRGKLRKAKKKINCVLVKVGSEHKSTISLTPFEKNYNIIGYVGKEGSSPLKRLGDCGDLYDVLRNNKAARTILDIPEGFYENLKSIFDSAYYLETEFLIGSCTSDNLKGLKKSKTGFEGIHTITIRFNKFFARVIKRGLDISLALLFLIISSPVFLFRYLQAKIKKHPFLVKISFYGRDGLAKNYYDFFSHAVKYSGEKVLQLSFPSLLAVLTGNLSLVGTLPLSREKGRANSKIIPGYWRRELVKPGVFGLVHISNEENYFDNELKYLEKMSNWYDIYLMLRGVIYKLKSIPGKKENAGFEVN